MINSTLVTGHKGTGMGGTASLSSPNALAQSNDEDGSKLHLNLGSQPDLCPEPRTQPHGWSSTGYSDPDTQTFLLDFPATQIPGQRHTVSWETASTHELLCAFVIGELDNVCQGGF